MAEIEFSTLENYLDSLVPERPGEMKEMEQYARQTGFPIVGPASGQFCYLMARMIKARRVFELGSGYGYSTAWFARAVKENGGGEVHHVVWDAELSRQAKEHLSVLGYDGMIRYQVSEAVQALRETDGSFDLIFNDIEKQGYPDSIEVIEKKLRPGGLLIVDNLLWSGKILDPYNQETSTEAIREFTRRITTSSGWVSSIVPIRDGLMVAERH